VLWRFLLMRVCVRFPVLLLSQQTVLPWWGERWHWPAFLLFVLSWSVATVVPLLRGGFERDWMTNSVLISALLTSLITLGRQLPLQNVILIGVMLSVAGAGWAELTQTALDWRGTTWRTTAFWTIVLLNVRGVAQFFLQRRRGSRFYGWELIGASAWLFMCSAARSQYKPIAILLLVSFFGTAALFVVSLPLFINKRPVEPPVSWQPIVVLPLLLLWAYLPRI
jgi:hypothetical protein